MAELDEFKVGQKVRPNDRYLEDAHVDPWIKDAVAEWGKPGTVTTVGRDATLNFGFDGDLYPISVRFGPVIESFAPEELDIITEGEK